MALDANGRLIEGQTSGGRPYVAIDKDLNAQRTITNGRSNHNSVQASATTAEASSAFYCDFISYIINKGDDDITFNLDASVTASGAFTLGPGEAISDLPRKVDRIYYKAASGTQPFRTLGVW